MYTTPSAHVHALQQHCTPALHHIPTRRTALPCPYDSNNHKRVPTAVGPRTPSCFVCCAAPGTALVLCCRCRLRHRHLHLHNTSTVLRVCARVIYVISGAPRLQHRPRHDNGMATHARTRGGVQCFLRRARVILNRVQFGHAGVASTWLLSTSTEDRKKVQ